jgi:hypothetical protein
VPREIRFRIRKDGRVETEFSGFPGEDCLAEAKNLAEALSSLGLKMTVQEVIMKTPAQIEIEVSQAEGVTPKAQRARVGHES